MIVCFLHNYYLKIKFLTFTLDTFIKLKFPQSIPTSIAQINAYKKYPCSI